MKYTKNLKNLTIKDVGIAGGKGASLGEMFNNGIPVPDGFVILSSTFDEFISQSELNTSINEILELLDQSDTKAVDIASKKIHSLIINTAIPNPVAKEILSSFEDLKSPFVAVRSSATSEDGVDHAWAGQLDSYLNTTEQFLLEKVQACWASLFTPRAILYRIEKDLSKTHISVAVVVQKMVNSEISGIAFSVHPITKDPNELIIEASFGLGEAIVSGSVTPDSYIVEKNSNMILDITVSSQLEAMYRNNKGENTWKKLNTTEGNKQALSGKKIIELAEIIKTIETHYGFPCDIEWAYEDNKFYIVQSRPITTL